MTYFGFLGLFVVIPILVLGAWMWLDARRGRVVPAQLRALPPLVVILAHVLIALVYTTPWDNYLVATRVWWYDPALVTGITLGWVPLEEYTFFLLQPILIGLLLYTLARYLPRPAAAQPAASSSWARPIGLALTGALCLASVAMLIDPWTYDTYLGLILVWALPPVMGQIAFGGDILWRERRMVLGTIVIGTLYLAAADSVAITSGTWTIDPQQSLPILLGGILPIEEFLFFMMTCVLIACGSTLMASRTSRERLFVWLRRPQPISRDTAVME
jgi:lycopene cyclase domain-containing protein